MKSSPTLLYVYNADEKASKVSNLSNIF